MADSPMLFNSFAFLLGFLPAALLIQAGVERFAPDLRLASLLALSIGFYGYWDWRFVPLIGLSIGLNWLVSTSLVQSRSGLQLATAVAANLAVLAVFKYLAPVIATLSFFAGSIAMTPLTLALPLGISFFTFHHIMYLTDLRAGRAPRFGLVSYALYIAFFPQVLAGPLVRWREVMPQFDRPTFRAGCAEWLGRGLILLVLGLVKKVFLGDPLADIAAPAFAAAGDGTLTIVQGWEGLMAFTFQIYFDFSGYTDMALGVALMFGIALPQNFARPYRAPDIAEFWRRWHMTLSRFLRDYLYIPLGGNRHGLVVQIAALMITMGLGGLWHGAGLAFVAWGLLQGAGLVTHLLWRRAGWTMPRLFGAGLTFLFVALAWVLFRAPSFALAGHFYAALFGGARVGRLHHAATLLVAAAVAMLGPKSWHIAQRAKPSWTTAMPLAVAIVAVLLQIGENATYEFIYFRF